MSDIREISIDEIDLVAGGTRGAVLRKAAEIAFEVVVTTVVEGILAGDNLWDWATKAAQQQAGQKT